MVVLMHARGLFSLFLSCVCVCVCRVSELEVFFLMPCHSTPFYSYIHAPIAMDFIKCLPPITYDGYPHRPFFPHSLLSHGLIWVCVCVCVWC